MKKEFIITNGLGGYLSSTDTLLNTRKYHGLLVAANLDGTRTNIVNKIEEEIIIEGISHNLSNNVFGSGEIQNSITPAFQLNHYPEFTYEFGEIVLIKSMVLVNKSNLLVVKYKILNPLAKNISLNIIPLIANRELHAVQKLSANYKLNKKLDADLTKIFLDEFRVLQINHQRLKAMEIDDVYYNFFYEEELQRGYEANEDLAAPVKLNLITKDQEYEFELQFDYRQSKYQQVDLVSKDYFAEYNDSVNKNIQAAIEFGDHEELYKLLVKQAEQFDINLTGQGLIAGYHWFGEWGRDTFMAAKGILLLLNKDKKAKELLLRWEQHYKNGIIPNIISLAPDYNSLDAVLWYAVFFREYWQRNKDDSITLQKILPKLEETLIAFTNGVNSIKINPKNGFLEYANAELALTWMDAKVNNVPVIDRSEAAVEIQALWFNFLNILKELKTEAHDQTHIDYINSLLNKLKKSFLNSFWNSTDNCLYDVVRADSFDKSIRPNQLLWIYLPFPMLDKPQAKQILFAVEKNLLTEVGLKTLSSASPDYRTEYNGNQEQRDKAYHQGTIWPFWLGIFICAHLKVNLYSKGAMEKANLILDQFYTNITNAGLLYIPEVFSAESQQANGCISQAWSVAFLLEALSELRSSK